MLQCCKLPCLELPFIDTRGQVPQPRLPSFPIVKYLDALGDFPDGLFSRLVATMMEKLILERTPETLHRSIIIAVAFFWSLYGELGSLGSHLHMSLFS
jgi:hypothetical protein